MMSDVLRAIAPDVWEANTPIRFGFVPLRHRMTVIRLHDGRLVVHSPSKLSDAVRASLAQRGEIAAIIAPSWWHDLWLGDWHSAYPDVAIYGAPALIKASKIEMLPLDGAAQPWGDELHHMQVHGLALWLDEFVFYHPSSKSLIVADLLLSPGEGDVPLARMASKFFVGPVPGCHFPRGFRPAAVGRHALRESIQRIAEWNFDRIIVGHGEVVQTGGKRVFLEAFRWLGLTESF